MSGEVELLRMKRAEEMYVGVKGQVGLASPCSARARVFGDAVSHRPTALTARRESDAGRAEARYCKSQM